MGWYRTCSICGLEGKGGFFCDCMFKQSNEIAESLKNMVLKRRIQLTDSCDVGYSCEWWSDDVKELVVIHHRFIGGEYGSPIEFELAGDKQAQIEGWLRDPEDWLKVEEVDPEDGPEICLKGF